MTNDPLEDAITAWYARKPSEYGRPTSADAIRWGWEAAMKHAANVCDEMIDWPIEKIPNATASGSMYELGIDRGLLTAVNAIRAVAAPQEPDERDTVERALAERDREVAELREALREWMNYGCPVCSGGDCASANPPVLGCPVQAGYAALRTKGSI